MSITVDLHDYPVDTSRAVAELDDGGRRRVLGGPAGRLIPRLAREERTV